MSLYIELKSHHLNPEIELHAQVAALVVFQLPRPTHERPFIQGLLDPCTNSMTAPNIPAEVLYDKKVSAAKTRLRGPCRAEHPTAPTAVSFTSTKSCAHDLQAPSHSGSNMSVVTGGASIRAHLGEQE